MATPGYIAPELDREHPLFDKLVTTEGFVQPSSIVIRLLEGKINVGHISMKVFRVEVTDNQNLQTLFYVDVHEENFQAFKANSKLTVSFAQFPNTFINLINRCLQGPVPSNFPGNPNVTFGAHLDLDTEYFTVNEDTTFSKVVHLNIKLTRGDDQAVKDYLSSRLSLSMDICNRRGLKIDNLEGEGSDMRQEIDQLRRGLDEALNGSVTVQKEKKAEYDSAIAALKSDFSEQLNRLREEAAENEKELTGQIHALMAELAQKKEELIGTSTDLQQQIATRSRELADLQDKLRREQESGVRLLGELDSVRGHNHNLSAKVTALEAQNGGAAGRIQALQEKIDGLIQVVQEKESRVAADGEAMRGLEARVQDKDASYRVALADIAQLKDELREANRELSKYMNRVQQLDAAVHTKNDIIRKQETRVQELTAEVRAQELSLQDAQHTKTALDREVADLQRKLADSEKACEDWKQQLEANRQVNDYLASEQNKHLLGMGFATPAQEKVYLDSFVGTGAAQSPPPTAEAYRYEPYAAPTASSPPAYDAAYDPAYDAYDAYTPTYGASQAGVRKSSSYAGAGAGAGVAGSALPRTTSYLDRYDSATYTASGAGGAARYAVEDHYTAAMATSSKLSPYAPSATTRSYAAPRSSASVAENLLLGQDSSLHRSYQGTSLYGAGSAAVDADPSGVDLDNLDYYALASEQPVSSQPSRIPIRSGAK